MGMRARAQSLADRLLAEGFWVRPAGVTSEVKAFLTCYETLTIGRFSAWVVLMGRPGPAAKELAARIGVRPGRCGHSPLPPPIMTPITTPGAAAVQVTIRKSDEISLPEEMLLDVPAVTMCEATSPRCRQRMRLTCFLPCLSAADQMLAWYELEARQLAAHRHGEKLNGWAAKAGGDDFVTNLLGGLPAEQYFRGDPEAKAWQLWQETMIDSDSFLAGRPTERIVWDFSPEDVLKDGDGEDVLQFAGHPRTWPPAAVGCTASTGSPNAHCAFFDHPGNTDVKTAQVYEAGFDLGDGYEMPHRDGDGGYTRGWGLQGSDASEVRAHRLAAVNAAERLQLPAFLTPRVGQLYNLLRRRPNAKMDSTSTQDWCSNREIFRFT